jgi:outer membrane protein, heavy metal efflux system
VLNVIILFAALAQGPAQAQEAAPLTLDRVVSAYVQNNLELQAARFRLERARAEEIAARLQPNPALTVSAENLRLSGPTPSDRLNEFSAAYAQTVELGGKRAKRESVAAANISVAEAKFADVMRQGIAEVKQRYFDALLARYNIQIATENRETFQQLVQFNLARFQEGAIPEGDLIKVRLERIKVDAAVKQAELNLRQAVVEILERLEEPMSSRPPVLGELEFRPMTANIETLRQTALQERPDVQAASREVQAAAQRLELEQARAKPDITPYAGYKRLANDNTLLVGVTIPLKVRDRNQGGIARAQAEAKAAQSDYEVAQSHALAEVESAYAAYETARDQVQTFRDELLNQADESRSIALAAYEEGAAELVALLEAQRTRAEVRQQYFKTLFDYQVSLSNLELAVGKEIQ